MKFVSRIAAPHWSATRIARMLDPMQEFVGRSESSGMILLAATVLALVIANSPLAGAYNALLETAVGVTAGPFALEETVLHWVNDSLMTVFFFVLGLVLGKPLGLLGACWLAIRLGIAALPNGTTWRHMLGVGILAGVGFTMSLFIAALAFTDPATITAAKLGIMLASVVAGSAGLLALRRMPTAVS